MGLRVPNRVHIMPVGYEYERIVQPAEKFRADVVVLIGHEEDAEGSDGDEHLTNAIEALESLGVEIEARECDIFDLYSSMGAIAESIAEHEDDEVFVNVSTGSKVTAIAGMIASMVLESTPYYVRAKDYENDPDDIEEFTELPTYPIDAPDAEQVDVLQFIDRFSMQQGPPTKGDVIHFSEQFNLDYVSRNVAGKGKYRLLDTHIVEPLKEREYIEESKQGRNKILSLTDDGRAALEAFQWLVDKEIDWSKLDDMLEDEGEQDN